MQGVQVGAAEAAQRMVHVRAGQGKAGQGRAGHGRAGQGKAGQGRARHVGPKAGGVQGS